MAATVKPNLHINFTDLILKRLKAPKQGQVQFFDKDTRGLSLLVSNGGTKTYLSKFKLGGKWQRRAIGRVKEMTVADARDQCRADRQAARKGIDPRVEAVTLEPDEPETNGLTVRDAIRSFIDDRCKHIQRTWDQTEGTLTRACELAGWLDKPVMSITRDDLRALHKRYLDQGKKSAASQAHTWIKSMWAWLLETDKIEADTLAPVKLKLPKAKRTDVYSDKQLVAIWRAAGELAKRKAVISEAERDAQQAYGIDLSGSAGIEEATFTWLMILLAPRKTALAMMRWGDLDKDMNVWTTPDKYVKRLPTAEPTTYRTPLSATVRRLLIGLDRGDPDKRVFPSLPVIVSKAGRESFDSYRLQKDLKLCGAPKRLSLHKLRHTVATWLEDHDHSEWERGLVLNHKGTTVTAGYSHGSPIGKKRELLGAWEKHVMGLVERR